MCCCSAATHTKWTRAPACIPIIPSFSRRSNQSKPTRILCAASPMLTRKRISGSGFSPNNFVLPALTIAKIYKSRWQVELFFKWIKQHLRIKTFYGTSENAVKTQIWIAVSVYVLVAIVRKRLDLDASLYQILQIFSVTLFEKMPILQVFQDGISETDMFADSNQLILFDL